jgi:hypothetical protein
MHKNFNREKVMNGDSNDHSVNHNANNLQRARKNGFKEMNAVLCPLFSEI